MKGFSWASSISLLALSQCESSGKLRTSTSTNATFDSAQGKATFSNFYIDNAGMYIVAMNVRTKETNDYNFTCLSEPLIIKQSISTNQIDTSGAPNMYFNFSGDFNSLTSDDIKQMKKQFYNCIIFQKNLVTSDTLQIYKGNFFVLNLF